MGDRAEFRTNGEAVDKVRASKAGHAFHEAWAARSALELLLPHSPLMAITLEGFDQVDEAELGIGAVEIADLVRYFGGNNVARASRTEIVQFKYSIASAEKAVRAVDLSSTLTKFAKTDTELRSIHGDQHVHATVHYDFATNRPIHPNLISALHAMVAGRSGLGDVATQLAQLTTALADYPYPHSDLLNRLSLSGALGSLTQAEGGLATILAAWSEPSDPDAEIRLLKLRNLVRTKAGPGSEADKRIDRVAVLAELQVDHEDRLYPTPDAFPEVATVIERSVLDTIVAAARTPGLPLIVHGAGGMGKTVLMQGLADRLHADGPVVLFDGFGAGRWRDLADGRHRPERTLVHLANLFAGQGLCDILLPIGDITSLLRAFRARLKQAAAAARQGNTDAVVTLVLDAIDHAGLAAKEFGTPSFAHALMRSLSVSPIEGVRIVASCRTERLAIAVGESAHRDFQIPAFSYGEAKALVSARLPDARPEEVAALLTRSGRNPRCLAGLIDAGRPFDPISMPGGDSDAAKDVLDTLIEKRLADARQVAIDRGASPEEINLLLAGLALLAPPVPVDELALAHGLSAEQVESFASDLSPLLERTQHGLMFRDEPTETLIRKRYGQSEQDRKKVVEALLSRQDTSNYAARALPALLTALGDADRLFALAFEKRVPPGASQVSARDIRLARITAALTLAGERQRRDNLLQLLLEASLVAAGHERSDRFLYEHPDLAAVAGDTEALRRLASTTIGWPGGKHASLALANAFAGDLDEARRNGRRAIDWHNWSAQSGRRTRWSGSEVARKWDDIGFTYVEMLTGNDSRVVRFYAGRGEAEAYAKFNDLFDLLERHRKSEHPPSERLNSRLRYCRARSRAFSAIALRFSDRDPESDGRLLARFAIASPSEERVEGLAFDSTLASARAFQLGLEEYAVAILESTQPRSPSIHAYSSYWPVDRSIDTTVLAAGVRAAIRRKPVTLFDIAPNELLALVPKSAQARGPAAFARVLNAKLAEPRYDGMIRRRRSKPALESKLRLDYARALSHRIEPLLKYAQAVADILRPPDGKTRKTMVVDMLDMLAQDVTAASDYPYQDGKAYRARAGFRAIFSTADALDLLEPTIADKLVHWAGTAPGLFTPQLTEVVQRLSRVPSCHTAALRLAAIVERRIQLDTDVAGRVAAYGILARAVWRVGTAEAAVYFRRALDLAEAIGSDDFDRTNHLLELTSHYGGPELKPEAGHTLARILELNQSDDGKFPWIEYAGSMVPVSGLGILATIARLDDRDAARLGLSLGPALTILVRMGKLPADLAAAVIGLAPPLEAWTWHLSDFASEVVAKLPPDKLRWFFEIMLIEIDREDQLSPSSMTIAPLQDLAGRHLAAGDPLRDRIEALAQRRVREEPPASEQKTAVDPVTPYPVPLDDPDAIDRAVLSEEVGPSGRRWPSRTLADLAAHATTPEERRKFVEAVVESSASSLADKVRALENPLKDWAAASPALREALPSLALRLADKHPRELAGSSSDAWAGWRRLVRDFRADQPTLVERVVAALGPEGEELGGNAWLALAAKLAPAASAGACGEGLERFLSQSADLLPVEVGDGPWNSRFTVTHGAEDIVAGLIWARLGHPVAAIRWRAAHAVRRLAEASRFDVIGHIVERFERTDASPFVDAKLPFYPLHARLWLLMALARIGRDAPHKILRQRAMFETVAFSVEFPHAVMRAVAVDALRAILPVISDQTDRDQLTRRLNSANCSPFPHVSKTDYGEKLYIQRPADKPRPADVFHLDHDFNKYQVERLCHVFGCAGWEVEDLVHKWVRHFDADVTYMHDCPRSSNYDESWSSGYVPERDRYGGYLGWHGLMLAAGELLATRTVTGEDWGGDAWKAFLAEYLITREDGLWLADASDPFPLDLPSEASLAMPGPGETSKPGEDYTLLTPLLGISDGRLTGDWLPVEGHWSLSNDLNVSVRSVLSGGRDARNLAMALLAEEPFFRWLPHDEDEIARHLGRAGHSVRAWIERDEHGERKFDRQDPYAATSAMQRPRPLAWVRDALGLVGEAAAARRWAWPDGIAFQADAWGAEGGRGEGTWSKEGARLLGHRDAVLALLQRTGLHLVGHLKLRRYHRGESSIQAGSTRAFTFRSMTFSIDPEGKVWTPRGLSRAARDALRKIEPRDRQELHILFKAFAALERI